MNHRSFRLFLLFALLLCACSPSIPDQASPAGRQPSLMPDYVDVTVPSNICPLNFMVAEAGDEAIVRLHVGQEQYVVSSRQKKMQFSPQRWQQLLKAACGGSIGVEVWTHATEGWCQYEPFEIHVAPEEIDPYISYRLIPPSYVAYEEISIAQRNLTSFDEQVIYNTMMLNTQEKGQCINCHSYQNYRTQNMLFHIRNDWGGTMLVHNGKVSKVNLKTPETLSAGVYPSWHPTEDLIAFSTNKTSQIFHNRDTAKIEVFDGASDLILYDVNSAQVSSISSLQEEMEIFPSWSPDGRWLYFCSAQAPFETDPVDSLGNVRDLSHEAMLNVERIHYDLYRMPFDPATRTFGPRQLLYAASADSTLTTGTIMTADDRPEKHGMSVTLPRLSPDGRWVAFARGNYGCFQVWHPESDIWVLDMNQFPTYAADALRADAPLAEATHAQPADTLAATALPRPRPLTALNSPYSESYPTFSSNGRWIMTASRRDDNNFTRPYIAYFLPDGTCCKPFELPQEDPELYTLGFCSYNRPEFMVEPVSVKPQEFARVSKDGIAVNATQGLQDH